MAKVEKCSKYLKENGEGRSNGVESEWDFKFFLRVQMVGRRTEQSKRARGRQLP